MIVYCVTNRMNKKQYVGMTSRTLEQRWNSHCTAARNGSPFRFHSAIRKYGEDAFYIEILYQTDSIDECRTIEEQTILDYNTMANGYNAKPGGCGGWIVPEEKYEEWLEKISKASFKENNGRYSGFTDDEILDAAFEYFNQNQNSSLSSFIEYSSSVLDMPSSYSKNRFSGGGSKNFKRAYCEKFGVSEEFFKYEKTEDHKKKLSEANKNKRWYSCDIQQISNQFDENKQPKGWVLGRKYGNKNRKITA